MFFQKILCRNDKFDAMSYFSERVRGIPSCATEDHLTGEYFQQTQGERSEEKDSLNNSSYHQQTLSWYIFVLQIEDCVTQSHVFKSFFSSHTEPNGGRAEKTSREHQRWNIQERAGWCWCLCWCWCWCALMRIMIMLIEGYVYIFSLTLASHNIDLE